MYDQETKFAILIKNIRATCKRSSSEWGSDIFIERSHTCEWSDIDRWKIVCNIFGIIHTRYDFLERWNYCKRLLLEELQVNRVKIDLWTSSWSSVTIFILVLLCGLGHFGFGQCECSKGQDLLIRWDANLSIQNFFVDFNLVWFGWNRFHTV